MVGGNSHGQLGISSYSEFHWWVSPGAMPTITAVAAGRDHSLALGEDGHVYVAGSNERGQIGLGSGVTTALAWADSGITSVTAIAAGWEHSLAIKSDGSVWACGANGYGQLGVDDTTDRTTWTSTGVTDAVSVAGGEYHSLVLRGDGRVVGAGGFQCYELGLGSQASRLAFTDLGLSGITQVAAGRWHSLAVDSAKRVWAAGNNSYGQAGRGDQAEVDTWVRNEAITGVTEVAAGDGYSLLLREDGYLYGSGRYESGQLGFGLDGPFDIANPTLIKTAWTRCCHRGVSGISTADTGNSVVWKDDGSVWVIGSNQSGQLGAGLPLGEYVALFARSWAMSGCVEAAAGGDWMGYEGHSLAVRNDGTLWVTGSNSNGQVGLGARSLTTTWTESTLTAGSVDIADVDAGGFHSLALDTAGTLWVCGDNSRGQLGLGDTTDRRYWTPSLDAVMAVAAGQSWSVAIQYDGTLWATGANDFAQTGLPGSSDALSWTQVSGMPPMKDVGTGTFYTIGVEADGTNGTLWSTGNDAWFESTMTAQYADGGFGHWLGLRSNGGVWAVGDNSWMALGAPVPDPGVWTQTASGARVAEDCLAGASRWSFYVDSSGALNGTGDANALGLMEPMSQTAGWVPIGLPRCMQPVSYAGAGTLGGTVGLRVDSAQEGLGDEAAWKTLRFVYDPPQPGDVIRFQVRTADTTSGLASATYRGADLHGPSYFDAGNPEAVTETLPDGRVQTSVPMRDFADPSYDDVPVSRCLEVWMWMDARPSYDRTPVLHEVTIDVEEPPAPEADGLRQWRGSDDATVAPGGWTNGTVALGVSGGQLAAGATTAWPEFELKPTPTAFDGSGIATGPALSPSGDSTLGVSGLTDPLAYHWRARLVDDLGRRSDWTEATTVAGAAFRVDDVVPSGLFYIEGDAEAVATRTIALTPHYADETAMEMCFQLPGDEWTSWVPFADTTPTVLPDADGWYTVACQVRDAAGNVNATQADGIRLDRVAPVATVLLDGGAPHARSLAVTAGCTFTDATSVEARFSVDGGTTWGTYSSAQATQALILPAGDGTKTVAVEARDAAGNVSAVATDQIVLDMTPPVASVVLDGGATHTRSLAVTAGCTFTDATSVEARFSVDGGTMWGPYSAAQTTQTLILPAGDGTKTVAVEACDAAGNVSAVATDQIVLDMTAPVTGHDAVAAYVSAATIHLTPTDAQPGPVGTWWRLGASGDWTTGTVVTTSVLG
ncbi:MAG: hypothetical protein C0418_05505, partial [Coriobacteriaceae bacterium]|nr:hypothetical protein [Coriobacteriaceae bacterium]